MSDNQKSTSLQEFYEGGIRLSHGVCGIVTTPVEYFLRPFFGTRYFDPVQMMFTCLLMMLLPLLTGFTNVVPVFGGGAYSGRGYVGLGTLSLLFFASNLIHGPRLWRRIMPRARRRRRAILGATQPRLDSIFSTSRTPWPSSQYATP